MPTNTSGLSPYVDTGTGAYEPPPAEVIYGTELDTEPTGAVDGPPAEVTTEAQPEYPSKPTGAGKPPPVSVTYDQDQSKARAEAKQVRAADVEDKAVSKSTKGRR